MPDIKFECKITKWREWPDFGVGITHNRIWYALLSDKLWYQRHEWRYSDGREVCDKWIPGIKGFPNTAVATNYTVLQFLEDE